MNLGRINGIGVSDDFLNTDCKINSRKNEKEISINGLWI
jgi:hypothetical protein